jgi:hypothetical protein
MAEYINPVTEFAKGYQAMGAVQEDIASKDILQQAYAGMTPEQAADPQKQQSIYNQAAMMAGQRGQASLAYSFQKQAKELDSAAQTKQINDLKVKEGKLSYAGQLVESATNKDELISAINAAGVDEPVALQLAAAVKRMPDTPEGFDQAKKMLEKVSMTAKEKIEAQKAVFEGQKASAYIENLNKDNIRADQEAARRREYEISQLTAKEVELGLAPGTLTKGLKAGAAPTKETPSGSFLEQTGARESGGDYSVVNKQSGALGKYQIMPNTYEGLRKQDPSLPSKEELLKNPAAQEKAARLLEQDVERNLKASGKEPTTANKNAYWYFGPTEGNKVLDANPDTPISSVVRPVVMEQNSNLKNKDGTSKTVGQVLDELNKGAPTSAAAEGVSPSLNEMYDKKRGGGLSVKEWSTINPTATQIGKEYQLNPMALTSGTSDEKKQANTSYQVTKLAEDTAEYVKEHRKAVGTLAAVIKKAQGMTGDLLGNIQADKRYTGDIAEMGKRLFALGLKDAGSQGRLNVYLERQFANFYDQSQNPETLLRIIKARQGEAFANLETIYGANKQNLDKSKYGLAFSDNVKDYLGVSQPSPEQKKAERTSPGFGGRSSGAGSFKSSKSALDEATAAGF